MAEHTPIATKQPYINNPFMIAVEGIKLFFTKATGVAILLVVISAVGTFNSFGGSRGTSPNTPPAPAAIDTQTSIAIGVAIGIFALIVTLALVAIATVLNGMSAYSAAAVANGKPATLKEAWRAALDRFWGLLWLQVLTGLKVFAWSLLFIVPGIIMFFRYSLSSIAFFDKDLRGNAAIRESVALTKGSWLTTFSSQVIFNIVTFSRLSALVTAASTAILYRQFRDTPIEERPRAHGLSIATLVIAIIIGLAAVAFISFVIALVTQGLHVSF